MRPLNDRKGTCTPPISPVTGECPSYLSATAMIVPQRIALCFPDSETGVLLIDERTMTDDPSRICTEFLSLKGTSPTT
jgi:hypothetical protein